MNAIADRPATLYEMSREMEEALSNISVDEETGEVTGLEEVEALRIPLRDKCINVARFIANNDEFVSGLEKMKANIERRIKTRRNLSERLKTRVLDAMIHQLDEKKLEDHDIVISARKSEFIEILNPELIDQKFIAVKTETAISKKEIKAAIKSGETVSGARLAESFTLQIK